VLFNMEIDGFAASAFGGGRLIPSDERSNQSSLTGLDGSYVRAFFGGAAVVFTLALAGSGRGRSGLERRSIISTGILM